MFFITPDIQKEKIIFCLCLCLVLLAGWFPFFGASDIFLGFWRVEFSFSLLLISVLAYLLYFKYPKTFSNSLSKTDINYIIFPLFIFTIWSGFSMIWAESWKLALYHTLLWAEYLIFYILIRCFLENKNTAAILLKCLSIMLVIISVPAVFEYFAYSCLGGATSLGIRYSKYGEQVLLLFPLILAGTLRFSGRKFQIGAAIIVLLWLFMISSLSRTNFLLFIFGFCLLTIIVLTLKQFRKYALKISAIGALLVIVWAAAASIPLLTKSSSETTISRFSQSEETTQPSYSNSFRKLMYSVSKEIIAAHPIIGIGAGNYGIVFDDYREIYGAENPADVNLFVAENELAERAHNEYVQIFAELGVIGFFIFLAFLASIGFIGFRILKDYRRQSIFVYAAFLGLVLFLVSSALTSFSFRLMQNGLVFFVVLAIAMKLSQKRLPAKSEIQRKPSFNVSPGLFFGIGIFVSLLMIGYCAVRVASTFYTIEGRKSESAQAAELYGTAVWLDDENPNPHYFLGMEHLRAKRFSEASECFRLAISKKLRTSDTYSYLATAEYLSGNSESSEKVLGEALRLYPQSTFVRTRYAFFLQLNGKNSEADKQLEISRKINEKQTNAWWMLNNRGITETTKAAASDKKYAAVLDLVPANGLSAIALERELINPQEKVSFDFDN